MANTAAEYAEARTLLQQAIDLYESSGDTQAAARASGLRPAPRRFAEIGMLAHPVEVGLERLRDLNDAECCIVAGRGRWQREEQCALERPLDDPACRRRRLRMEQKR